VLFPIKYNDRFYEDALKVGEFAKFGIFFCKGKIICYNFFLLILSAWYKNLIVGTVCCRKEPNDNKTKKVYIIIIIN
jgi:hypothetical protein